ncbi:MAG: ATP-binding protein [candidate division KSB1 bacterium]|nr:ATP-binding protein [candidate division KSB1 bacterium]
MSAGISAADVRVALNRVMRDSLPPVSVGLCILYAIFAVSHALLLPPGMATTMSLVAAGTAVALLMLRLALGRWQISERWAHPIGTMIAGLVLLNSLLHLYLTYDPLQTTNLVLLVVGVGFLFLSFGWLTLVLVATFVGWSGIALTAPSPEWPHFGFALFSASVLAVLVHAVRVRTLKRLERLRLQDERRNAELEAALASTEAARRLAEASRRDLMQSEAWLRLLTNQMPAVLWTTDAELRFTSALGHDLPALDLVPEQISGRTLSEYFRTTAANFIPIAAHRRALAGESVAYEMYWKEHLFDCQVEPLHDTEGKLIGVIGIAFDITERKSTEDKIKVSLKEKDLLLKEIHHRVKNNLQVIASLLNLQAGYIKDESAHEIFRESQNRIKAMALIHEKLYHSQDLTSIDFASYIRNLAVHLFRSYKINAHAVNLQIEVDPIVLDIDTAIPCGLIVNELVSNSLKHAFLPPWQGKTGEIRIAMHQHEGKRLALIVSDTGVGFPKDLDFRNTASLGLQLVNTLTEQLEGTIALDTNGGTTFKIMFRH